MVVQATISSLEEEEQKLSRLAQMHNVFSRNELWAIKKLSKSLGVSYFSGIVALSPAMRCSWT
eukprot:806460-Pleurochrysis_carterae.AAC.1